MEDIQILELVDSQPPIPYFVEENEDEQGKLVTWFGDPKKDVISAKDWIQSFQVSIPQTFYEQLFGTKVFCIAFLYLCTVWICNFLEK